MNSDHKLGTMTPPSRQDDKSHGGNSRVIEFPITNNISKSSQDKVENSVMSESEKELKQTPSNGVSKGENYGLQIFDMIQNSLFKDQFASVALEKESTGNNQDINNILQERDSIINLNLFLSRSGNQDQGSVIEMPREILPVINSSLRTPSVPNNNNNNPNEIPERSANRIILNINNNPTSQTNPEAGPIGENNTNNNNNQAQENPPQNENGMNPKIIRQLEFYFISLAFYILGFLILENYVEIQILLLVLLPWICHRVYRTFRKLQVSSLTTRQKRSKFLDLAELLFLAIFTIVGAIRLKNPHIQLSPATIPGYLNILAWCTWSDPIGPPSSFCGQKIKRVLKKLILWTQLLLVGLKADEKLNSWSSAMNLTYYLLFGFIFYSILVFFLFISTMLGCRRTDTSYRLNIIGFGWYFMVSMYSWVWFYVLINTTGYLDDKKSKEALQTAIGLALAHSVILIIYATLLRNKLTRFLRFETSAFTMRTSGPQQNGIEKYVRFEVAQGDMPYLITISPTFYTQMKEAFTMKNKSNLLEWISQINKEKTKKYMRAYSKGDISRQADSKLNVKDMIMPSDIEAKVTNKTQRSPKKEDPLSLSVNIGLNDQSININNSKIFYSFDDMAIYDNIKRPVDLKQEVPVENESEKTCYICFERPSNAVFMNCGHGGVCYECALESWKKSDSCLMCRQKIESILKVNTIEKLKVSKVIHTTKKIVENKIIKSTR